MGHLLLQILPVAVAIAVNPVPIIAAIVIAGVVLICLLECWLGVDFLSYTCSLGEGVAPLSTFYALCVNFALRSHPLSASLA